MMDRILTKDEISFLVKLSALLEEYGALISAKGDMIQISVFRDGKDSVETPIEFCRDFDETDIRDMFYSTRNLLNDAPGMLNFIKNVCSEILKKKSLL